MKRVPKGVAKQAEHLRTEVSCFHPRLPDRLEIRLDGATKGGPGFLWNTKQAETSRRCTRSRKACPPRQDRREQPGQEKRGKSHPLLRQVSLHKKSGHTRDCPRQAETMKHHQKWKPPPLPAILRRPDQGPPQPFPQNKPSVVNHDARGPDRPSQGFEDHAASGADAPPKKRQCGAAVSQPMIFGKNKSPKVIAKRVP